MKRLINLIVFIVILGSGSLYYFNFRNNLNREIEDIQYTFNKKDKDELMEKNRKIKQLQEESNSLEVRKSFLENKNYQIKDEIMVIRSKIDNYRRDFAKRLDDDLKLKRKDVENKILDSKSKVSMIEGKIITKENNEKREYNENRAEDPKIKMLNKLKNEKNQLESECSSLKDQLDSALSRFSSALSAVERDYSEYRYQRKIVNNTNEKKKIIDAKNRMIANVKTRINYINNSIDNINSKIEDLENAPIKKIERPDKSKEIKDLEEEIVLEEKNQSNLIDTLSNMTIESIMNEEPDLKQYNQRLMVLTKEASEKTLDLEATSKKLGRSYIACDFAQAERNDLTEGKTRKLEKLTDKQTQLQQKVGSIYAIGMIIGILLFLIFDRRFAQNYDL
ncbi:MAG: hypothetical protein RR719_08720 [Akkermansia sp.]